MIVQLIEHTKLNYIISTPTFLKIILDNIQSNELENIECALVGAEACPQDILNNFGRHTN
jgi:acyl-CoA synthetase (AMP-forming)/AMP-acid ligase II